jgi:hypothetical protein
MVACHKVFGFFMVPCEGGGLGGWWYTVLCRVAWERVFYARVRKNYEKRITCALSKS